MYLPRTMHVSACVWGDFLVTATLLGTRACLQFWDENFECVKVIFTPKGILGTDMNARSHSRPFCLWGDYLAVGLGPIIQLWTYELKNGKEQTSKKPKLLKAVAEIQGMYEEDKPSPLQVYWHAHIRAPRCQSMFVFRDLLWTVPSEGKVAAWKLQAKDMKKPAAQLLPATDAVVWCDHLVTVSPENIIKIYYMNKDATKFAELVRFDARADVVRLIVWQNKLCIVGDSVVKLMNFGDFQVIWASAFSSKNFTGHCCIWNSYLWLQDSNSFTGLTVSLPWAHQRLLWVAWMKNEPEACWLAAMPKEIIFAIIKFIKRSAIDFVHPNAEIPTQFRFNF